MTTSRTQSVPKKLTPKRTSRKRLRQMAAASRRYRERERQRNQLQQETVNLALDAAETSLRVVAARREKETS